VAPKRVAGVKLWGESSPSSVAMVRGETSIKRAIRSFQHDRAKNGTSLVCRGGLMGAGGYQPTTRGVPACR
jgi:hypothetical protein